VRLCEQWHGIHTVVVRRFVQYAPLLTFKRFVQHDELEVIERLLAEQKK
jgi:hypothetical protein